MTAAQSWQPTVLARQIARKEHLVNIQHYMGITSSHTAAALLRQANQLTATVTPTENTTQHVNMALTQS
jgi:hypothetical protein